MKRRLPEDSMIRHNDGRWYLLKSTGPMRIHFSQEKHRGGAVLEKAYYSSEDVKAQGMKWVTIRGTHVLIKPLAEGGYAVVGGAGGKMNHLKIDKIASEADYKANRKRVAEKRKVELQHLTKEEIHDAAVKKKVAQQAKATVRESYTAQVGNILGVSTEDLRNQITARDMDEIANKARDMVEGRRTPPKDMDAAIEAQTEKEIQKAMVKEVKSIERNAMDTLMQDYDGDDDPSMKADMKKLLDIDKAKEILQARNDFKKQIKEIGKGEADIFKEYKVGDVMAGPPDIDSRAIEKEIENAKAVANNVALYDRLNVQSRSIQKHIDQGVVSALNGIIGDVYESGATFSAEAVEGIGLDGLARAVALKIKADGMGSSVSAALEAYTTLERAKVVKDALGESDKRFQNAEDIRGLARDTDDAEAILAMASANGYALKQITAGQRALGTAVGSLRAAAHLMNALEEPSPTAIQVDMGKDLSRARQRAKDAGLVRGTYKMKTTGNGNRKRYVMELPAESIDSFITHNKEMRKDADTLNKIKRHEMNDGYMPPGMAADINGKPFKLDDSQESGLRFFKERKQVLLDFQAGIGKTAIGTAAAMEMIHNMGAKKVLIVAPAKNRDEFYAHRKKYLDKDNQKIMRLANSNTSRKDRLAKYEHDGILVIGHEQLRTDVDAIKAAGFDGVIIDEIHELTTGGGKSARYRGMMELQDVPLKIGMSGTNIKNKKDEMYKKINWLNPDHNMGTQTEFNKKYKGLNQGTGIFQSAANEAFRKDISDNYYNQTYNLDAKNEIKRVSVEMNKEERSAMAASERQYREDRKNKKPGASAQRDSRNYRIVTEGSDGGSSKMDEIIKNQRENHEGEKAVIHVTGLDSMTKAATRLEKEYGKGTVGMIHGDSTPGEMEKIKSSFNDPAGKIQFIVGTKAIESGHNLQHGGTVTHHLDIPDTYAAFNQRNARVHRKGQENDTTTYLYSGKTPLDMRKEDIMNTKQKESGILGNTREVESMDETGFYGLLNKFKGESNVASA